MLDFQDDIQEIRVLTKAQADVVKAMNPSISLWHVVFWQSFGAIALSCIGFLVTGKGSVAYSLAWGGFCVVLPAVIFARGMLSKVKLMNAGASTSRFLVWEAVKIVLTVLMLLLAPKVVLELSWLALIAGFVVTMKVYWLACFWMLKRSRAICKK